MPCGAGNHERVELEAAHPPIGHILGIYPVTYLRNEGHL